LQPNPELNLDLDKINDILEKSLVRFSPLKRLIFKNDYAPNWVKGDKSLFIPMLLFKKFHTSDIPTIEKMVGNYSDYIKRIQDHINSGDPFALYTKENEMYSVINKYEAWDILYNKITNEDLIKFKKIAGEILKYDNPKFDLDDDKISFASIFLEGNPIYSETIRKSVVDTIILFKKFSRKNEYSNYNFFDDIVKEYYESIDCEKKWINFSEIAHYLVEYSPEMYLEKIEASINKDEFKSLFKVPNNILGSSGKYIKILWGLEKLLYIEDYVKETICIIAKLAEYEVDYKNHGNNPMNILKDAFIASDNTINISLLDRCKLLSHIVEKYKIGHALLSSVLPKYPNSWSHFVKPDYLTYDFKYKIIYIHEQIDNFNTYYEIYVDNFSDSLEHMSDLYSNIYFLKLEVGCKISKIIIELIKESDDISKYKLEKKVRKLLYGFYNYDNELWKLSELEKNHLEDIMKSITYTSDKYKYLYLFEKWSTYIISKIAKEDIEVEIYNLKREAILELKKSCSDMVEMCNEIPDDGPTSIAQYIYKYYHDNKYNIKFIIDMFNIKKIKILGEYITNVSQFEGIPAIIKIINCNEFKSVNIENKVVILKYSKITEELIMFINSNEEVAKLYWSTISLRVIPEDIFERIYENLLKHGNYIACLELISNKKGNIEKKIQLLEKIKSDEMTCYSMTEYYINRIFKSIYSYENKDKDRIINLEVHFMNLIDEEYKLKYFKNKLFSNSKILADLVKSAYISDNHIKKVLNNQEKIIAQNCYRIIEKISEIELNEEDMDIWVDSYFLLLKENNQISVGTSVLGSLLAKSKKDETDLIYPRKINRLIIEKYYSDELSKAFKTQEYNNRGVHTVDSGKGELKLSKQYEKWSNVLKPNYKKTAKILHEISERYKLDAIRERKESNYL